MANEEYEVEKLIAHQPCVRFPGTIEYLIKWRNFGDEENSWEREANVFALPLIDAYWKTQPITRSYYLKSIKTKKKTVKEPKTTKKRIKKYEKKSSRSQKHNTSSAIELSLKPEEGLHWSDLEKITNVFHSERNGLFSEAKWSNDTTTFIPNFIIRNNQPSALIEYYEYLLEFRA